MIEGVGCWNGLSPSDQGSIRLYGRPTEGDHSSDATHMAPYCPNNGTVAVEFRFDQTPGARVYCLRCGLQYMMAVAPGLADQ